MINTTGKCLIGLVINSRSP